MRVLLVDDEIELVSAMAERLDMRGISAQWAVSAEEALKLIDEGCFDIAVLDVKMPETGGVELMQRVRAKCPDMHFIFLTGHGSEQIYQEVTDKCAGALYLVKPVDIQRLIDEMKDLMKCKEKRKNV
jgi:DNA-binding NtrC family response regulator